MRLSRSKSGAQEFDMIRCEDFRAVNISASARTIAITYRFHLHQVGLGVEECGFHITEEDNK
jgi:hypothetical protein